ncbi:hypothetical protein HAX54_005133 [Datura stramonium]|uniref:Uncharacterized protein n=1 Tax=Datura stramonium TaxID=4076 RepID=A0ABS8TAJ2_DATST|nr:hypothetical protein [Datura stramonium]
MWLDLICLRLIPSRNALKVPIEVSILLACIMDHVHINGGEIIADQFKQRAKQQATTLSFPNMVSQQCDYIGHQNRQRGSNYEASKVYREHDSATTSASTHTAAASLHTNEFHSSLPPDFLNISQRAKMHESQVVQLAKAIPSIIQIAIKKALYPAKDKLTIP